MTVDQTIEFLTALLADSNEVRAARIFLGYDDGADSPECDELSSQCYRKFGKLMDDDLLMFGED